MKILNASEPEFGRPMTEDEVRFFLVNSHKNVHIYCVDDDRIPYKGVRGKGTVRISEDIEYNLSIIKKL